MKRNKNITCALFIIATTLLACAQKLNVSKIFTEAEKQTHVMLQEITKAKYGRTNLVSPRTFEHDTLRLVPSTDWTSGFFPGVLWYLYAYTLNSEWKQYAEAYTSNIEKEKYNNRTHDMGFKVYCSFGTGYSITGNTQYKDVIIHSARTLSTRFNQKAGVIRSWDFGKDKWDFPVIVDNMLNLELLFAATRLSGDSSFYYIAKSHANKTMANHFRSDNSSYHVVDYDTTTGGVNKKTTHQGYSNESSWSRGQGWGLYGFTMCYRETKDPAYLAHAERIAGFVLNHPNMPRDLVPYWDYDAPAIPNEPRDASAAAVFASALYELSTYSSNGSKYKTTADKIMRSLTKNYRAPFGTAKGFLLLHSTGHKPHNSEVDGPLSYADYYYLEALLRSKRLREGKILF
jgi:unsaturated chondroitin disaccharide hydrolase